MWENKPIGYYEPQIEEKGVNEAFIEGIREGQVYWTVKLEDGCFDTLYQSDAIIISLLSQINNKLKGGKHGN